MNKNNLISRHDVYKNIDIKCSAHEVFLEEPSSGTINANRFESQIILSIWEHENQRT